MFWRGSLLAALCLLWVVGPVTAQDPEARARAALALSKVKSPASQASLPVAPMPRELVVVSGYSAARDRAVREHRPVVLYVGCNPSDVRPISGAVVSSVPSMAGYSSGSLLVCYPSGPDLWVHRSMPCSAGAEDVDRAVKQADAKKGPPPAGRGKRLDWS